MSNNNPFATAIANAEAREDAAAQLREEQRQQRANQARQAAADKATKRQQRELHDFGQRFLEVVVEKVVRPEWKPGYMKMIQQFSEGLLMKGDQSLPDINVKHQEKILQIFSYGLCLAAQHGVHISDDFFYGQRLLADQQSGKVKPVERLVIRKGERPRSSQVVYSTATNVVELPPATTPRTKHGKGQHKPAKVG